MSDDRLLARYATTRDAEAFRLLVERYDSLVYATCLRITGNRHDAEDAAQESFLALARHAGSIRTFLPAWLHTTARRAALAITQRTHKHRTGLAIDDLAASEPTMARIGDREPTWTEREPHIDAALGELGEDLRAPLVLYYLHGQTQSQIAQQLGVDQSTISRTLDKGVTQLRQNLRRAGIGVSAASLVALLPRGAGATPPELTAALGKLALAGVGPKTVAVTSMAALAKLTLAAIVLVACAGAIIAASLSKGEAMTSATPKAATMPSVNRSSVVRQNGRVWIEGLQNINYGGAYLKRQDSQVACLAAALRCAGQDVTYSDVMGLSGCAFKLTVGRDVPIHLVHSEFGMEWGPIMRDVFGMSYASPMGLNDKEDPNWRQQVVQKIRPAIEQGIPAFGFNSEWYMIVGYAEDGSSFKWLPYGDGGGYKEGPKPSDNIWFYCVMTRTGEPMDRKQAVLRSLQMAVRFANSPTTEGAGQPMYWGFAAYEVWMDALINRPERTSTHANSFVYTQLLTSREAAADYLDRYAVLFEPAMAARLHEAAACYQQIAQRLRDGADCIKLPWETSYTPENRVRQVELLRDSLADERTAIATITQVLQSQGNEVLTRPASQQNRP